MFHNNKYATWAIHVTYTPISQGFPVSQRQISFSYTFNCIKPGQYFLTVHILIVGIVPIYISMCFTKSPIYNPIFCKEKLPFLWNIQAQWQDKYKVVNLPSHLPIINLHTLPFSNTTRQLKWASVSKGQPGLYKLLHCSLLAITSLISVFLNSQVQAWGCWGLYHNTLLINT